MKTYELWLHGKQGDDLQTNANASKDASGAFFCWSLDFEKRIEICHRISDALEGRNVKIEGEGNFIFLTPLDENAEVALDALALCKFIRVVDADGLAEEEPVEAQA